MSFLAEKWLVQSRMWRNIFCQSYCTVFSLRIRLGSIRRCFWSRSGFEHTLSRCSPNSCWNHTLPHAPENILFDLSMSTWGTTVTVDELPESLHLLCVEFFTAACIIHYIYNFVFAWNTHVIIRARIIRWPLALSSIHLRISLAVGFLCAIGAS